MSVIKVNTIQNANGTTALSIAANGQLSRVNTAIISDGTYSTSANNVIQGSAKAWINYNAVGQSITSSYNVSSVTYRAEGRWTINFTTALADSNYATVFGAKNYSDGTSAQVTMLDPDVSQTSSACGIINGYAFSGGIVSGSNPRDTTIINAVMFR